MDCGYVTSDYVVNVMNFVLMSRSRIIAIRCIGSWFAQFSAEATVRTVRRMHEGIARSWCPDGKETGFRIEQATGGGDRRILRQCEPRFMRRVETNRLLEDSVQHGLAGITTGTAAINRIGIVSVL